MTSSHLVLYHGKSNIKSKNKLGSVAVDFLFIVTHIVGVCNVLCFVVRYFVSILALQSS